jgi:hypothetical protein
MGSFKVLEKSQPIETEHQLQTWNQNNEGINKLIKHKRKSPAKDYLKEVV